MENREYPKTYFEFETKTDGAPKKYWIQDATEDMFDEIVEHFVTGFLKDEPVGKCLNGLSDDISTRETRVMQRHMLEQKLSLVCMTRNEEGEPKIAGFNILCSSTSQNKEPRKYEGWFINFMVNLFRHLDDRRNVFEEFGVDKCLKAMGLYVLPDYRGEGLGAQLLKARIPMGKSLGYKVTTTVFTSIVSQKQAYKAGFQDYYCIDYDELCKTCPEFCIPNIQEHTKAVKVLYKLIE